MGYLAGIVLWEVIEWAIIAVIVALTVGGGAALLAGKAVHTAAKIARLGLRQGSRALKVVTDLFGSLSKLSVRSLDDLAAAVRRIANGIRPGGRAGGPAASATPPAGRAGTVDAAGRVHIRQQYIDEVLRLQELALSARAAGQSAEATARLVHAQRNALKLKYRNLSPPDAVRRFEARNIERYGNPLGPSIEQLRAQGKTWEQIIESASRPGGADLGL